MQSLSREEKNKTKQSHCPIALSMDFPIKGLSKSELNNAGEKSEFQNLGGAATRSAQTYTGTESHLARAQRHTHNTFPQGNWSFYCLETSSKHKSGKAQLPPSLVRLN